MQIIQNFCSEFVGVFELIGNVFVIFKLIIPLIIIGFVIIDFYKSIISNEIGTINKAIKKSIIRIISAIIIFFLPTIIGFVFSLIGVEKSGCLNCMLNTKNCEQVSSNSGQNNDEEDKNNIVEDFCTVEDEDCINYSIYIE